MIYCNHCNKKITSRGLRIKIEGKPFCEDCVVKTKYVFQLIEDSMKTYQYRGTIELCKLLIKKINLLPKQEQKAFLVSAYANKGIAYLIIKEYSKAINSFKKALKIDSTDIEILQKLMAVYLLDNKKEKATKTMEKILLINPKDKLTLDLKRKYQEA